MLYEYELSSVAAVTAVLEIEGASFVLTTVKTYESLTDNVPSLAVTVIV